MRLKRFSNIKNINFNINYNTCKSDFTNIIENFDKIFKNKIDEQKKKDMLKSLNKPEILDSLESTKNIVYKNDNTSNNNNNLINIIKNKKDIIEKENIVDNFVDTFEKEFSRKPSVIEIYDNLDNKLSEDVIKKYLNSNKWFNRK